MGPAGAVTLMHSQQKLKQLSIGSLAAKNLPAVKQAATTATKKVTKHRPTNSIQILSQGPILKKTAGHSRQASEGTAIAEKHKTTGSKEARSLRSAKLSVGSSGKHPLKVTDIYSATGTLTNKKFKPVLRNGSQEKSNKIPLTCTKLPMSSAKVAMPPAVNRNNRVWLTNIDFQ